eukprot:Skav228478  [mRNA]  locus=scaffold1092:12191:19188:- [translate_table: standard]
MSRNLSHLGQNAYYGGDECRPLVNFNQTLCETSYRDAEAFCDCLCPTMGKLQIPRVGDCERKILEFLFLGRRGYDLSLKYQLSGYCAAFLCEHFTKLGDPNPAYPVAGIPSTCKKLNLPWRLYSCNELLSRKPYNPLPWQTPYPEDSVLECTDQTLHQDPEEEVLKLIRTTTPAPSFAQQIGDYAWAGSAVLVVIGLTCSCLACYYMGMINAMYVKKVVIGLLFAKDFVNFYSLMSYAVRKAGWKHIEDLRAAVQAAKSQDISESHMHQAEELLAALVARTHELPADRCVLDPDGEGVKLLPKGHNRAVWPITGAEISTPSSTFTREMGDMSVPKDILGDAAIDDARPVTVEAEWAKSSTCKAGRDCPWRHCKPQVGNCPVRSCQMLIFSFAILKHFEAF